MAGRGIAATVIMREGDAFEGYWDQADQRRVIGMSNIDPREGFIKQPAVRMILAEQPETNQESGVVEDTEITFTSAYVFLAEAVAIVFPEWEEW